MILESVPTQILQETQQSNKFEFGAEHQKVVYKAIISKVKSGEKKGAIGTNYKEIMEVKILLIF